MERLIGLSLAITLVLALAPPVSASTSEDYAGFGEFLTECAAPFDLPWAACFQVPSGTTHIDIDATDDSGQDVVLWVVYERADGSNIDNEFVCNGVDKALPSETARVEVVLQDPSQAILRGLDCVVNTPTTGTLTAAFS